MSMLISDYDGTFSGSVTSNLELYLNIEAVKNYMKKGNTFVIATGRAYSSIKAEIKKYNIPYNYLICNDGSTVFDDKNLLFANCIDNNISKEIIKFAKDINLDYILFNSHGITKDINEIVEISLLAKNLENYKILKSMIDSNFNQLCISKLYRNVFIRKNCHKDYGIEVLCDIIGRPNNIYTIGNDVNDIEMLKKYNGYRILLSSLHDCNIKPILSVHTLVKKII